MNIKSYLTGEQQAKKILRNKKLSVEQKCEKIIDHYKSYFVSKLQQDATMAALEWHFEKFVINNQTDELKYKQYYNYEYENIMFVKCYSLAKIMEYFITQEICATKLPEDYRECFRLANKMAVDCDFAQYEDLSEFYENEHMRRIILKPMVEYVEFLKTVQLTPRDEDYLEQI